MIIDRKLAKSYNQELAIELLEKFGSVAFKEYLVSKAYYSNYAKSWKNLYERLKKSGYPVLYIPGKRGGVWTSRIILIS